MNGCLGEWGDERMMFGIVLAFALLTQQKGGIEVSVESEREAIDPGRSVILTMDVTSPRGVRADLPDLASRAVGFSQAEDFAESPVTNKSGSVVQSVTWKLVPKPCEKEYRIRPFVIGDQWFGPIRFAPPAEREPVTGGIEVDLEKDVFGLLSPYLRFAKDHWFLLLLGLAGLGVAGWALVLLVRYILRSVREHMMSPIERAWVELDRLLKKGLPGRGRYKDFYVELTMVVRRYIQRKYGIRAPHLTTEEFLLEAKPSDELRAFLESADMVKFAGVEATPEMADSATASARDYLEGDSKEAVK